LPYTANRYKWIFVTVTRKSFVVTELAARPGALDEPSLKARIGCSGSFSKSSQAELGGGAKASARLGCSGPRSCGDLAGRAAVCRDGQRGDPQTQKMGKERSFEADAAVLGSNQGLSVQATRLDQWRNVVFFGRHKPDRQRPACAGRHNRQRFRHKPHR